MSATFFISLFKPLLNLFYVGSILTAPINVAFYVWRIVCLYMESCLFIYGELSVYIWMIVCLYMDFILCTPLN